MKGVRGKILSRNVLSHCEYNIHNDNKLHTVLSSEKMQGWVGRAAGERADDSRKNTRKRQARREMGTDQLRMARHMLAHHVRGCYETQRWQTGSVTAGREKRVKRAVERSPQRKLWGKSRMERKPAKRAKEFRNSH
jgi:hypothetical protein